MGVIEGRRGRYWNVRNGQFEHLDKNTGETRICRGLFGMLDGVTVTYDEGDIKKNIAPGHKVHVFLQDGEECEIISCKAETTFGWMLAQSLSQIKPRESVLIETSCGDNEKICFAWVKRFANGVRGDIERPKYPEDRDAKIAQGLSDLLNHPANAKRPHPAPAGDGTYDPFEDE